MIRIRHRWVAAAVVLALAAAGCSGSNNQGGRQADASGKRGLAAQRPADTPDQVAETRPARQPAELPGQGAAGETPPVQPAETSPAVGHPVDIRPGAEQTPWESEPVGRTVEGKQDAVPPSPFVLETPDPSPDTGPGIRGNPLRQGNLPGSERVGPALVGRRPGSAEEPDAHNPSAPGGHGGKHGESDFDPIQENGPIFVGWPKPKLALLISGRQNGYLEPCGCAGLDRMKGGISRRQSLFRTMRNEWNWPTVGLDVGGLIKGFGKQAELKFHTTVNAMTRMGYDAATLGPKDLRLPATELLSRTAGGQAPHFLSANVGIIDFDYGMPYRVVEAGGVKLAITSVLGQSELKEINNPELQLADPVEKLGEIVPKMKKEAELLILLAHADMDETTALAKRFPDFRFVVTAGGGAEPPRKATELNGGRTLLIEVGEKGMNVVVVGLFDDPQHPLRYQRVPLDSRFANSQDMREEMRFYQSRLESAGFDGLGLREIPYPGSDKMGRFVGSQECKACHEESYKIWKKSGHAKAYQTLAELDVPRLHDPECIACHVVGWHPQKYFPYKGGYSSYESTPHLIDVGCESCHGPGEAHVRAEQAGDLQKQWDAREAVVITKEESEKSQCLTCHDLDNSPDFDFETYWPEVEHYEFPEDEFDE